MRMKRGLIGLAIVGTLVSAASHTPVIAAPDSAIERVEPADSRSGD